MAEDAIRQVFLAETKELLENLENDIVRYEETKDPELIHSIFRYVHTLKGGSGMAGYDDVYQFTHALENVLDSVRNGIIPMDDLLADIVFASIDVIRLRLYTDSDQQQMLEKFNLLQSKINDIETLLQKKEEAEPAEEPEEKKFIYNFFRVKAKFRDDIFKFGIDPLIIMEDLSSLGKIVELRVNRNNVPLLQDIDPEQCYIAWDVILKTKSKAEALDDVFIFVRDDNEITITDVTKNYVAEQVIEDVPKLGELLLSRGMLTENEFEDVLNEHEKTKKKVGEIAVTKGYIEENDVSLALKEQDEIKKQISTSTLRVDAKKVDNLMNLLGELVIGFSGIKRIAEEIEDEKAYRLNNALYSVDRIIREFQEHLMRVRMVPIGPIFEQYRRFIRDTAKAHGKSIRLEITGGDTEIDKTVIERISDPLKHLIRNAIDHGIEAPHDREEKGKPREGLVSLKAYHQEGNMYIEVSDDGAGIDKEKVIEKAVAKGLLSKNDEIPDSTLYGFLFEPGFSTSESVGDLSGRGVGLDVVKTNIEALRGTVDILSQPEKGTTFIIKLPLTLAIIDGMLVRVAHETFIIPILSIIESIKPVKDDIKTIESQGEVVHIRGEYVPLLHLHQEFNLPQTIQNPWDGLVVVVESQGRSIGLIVDELIGQQQIVIKSLDNQITTSRAISGAAILGDGTIALIIDVHGFINR
ncbi:MAG TPA: chemotaxis protein CheA [Spirochaetota bacterium]|nr:chemotaxis protein CheA [Spirochaetota bacterium]HOM87846.1 chemotaxis protein CheA [Spirochaetota bacterium]HOR94061.1 chemotaxis protein CheA [Spirochaetota bacterium]HOT19367.1 chemotaxis protein CheA [Spirochaetota bacterium]HQI38387.1 chemotaxis protein CheA [Spirochaetota bacterium]